MTFIVLTNYTRTKFVIKMEENCGITYDATFTANSLEGVEAAIKEGLDYKRSKIIISPE